MGVSARGIFSKLQSGAVHMQHTTMLARVVGQDQFNCEWRGEGGGGGQQGMRPAQARPTKWGSVCGGRPGQCVEEQGTWASHTRKHSEAGCGRPEDGGVWTAKTVKRPRQQPAQPPIRQLLGAADAQTAHPATSSTAPVHQPLGSANAETTPAGAPAAAADRKQRPYATCEGKNG